MDGKKLPISGSFDWNHRNQKSSWNSDSFIRYFVPFDRIIYYRIFLGGSEDNCWLSLVKMANEKKNAGVVRRAHSLSHLEYINFYDWTFYAFFHLISQSRLACKLMLRREHHRHCHRPLHLTCAIVNWIYRNRWHWKRKNIYWLLNVAIRQTFAGKSIRK